MPPLPSVRVFGGAGVDDVDGPVSIGGPRQRRLLSLLTLRAGSVVDIDWLAEYLWDDDDRPADPPPRLRTLVSRLRSSFPATAREWIVTESEGYRLEAPADTLEHRRFADLRMAARQARERQDPQAAVTLLDEALALWRGDPFRELEGLEIAEAESERLRLDRLDTMEERWEAVLALGRHTQITGELAAYAAEHGERDRAVQQFALALHRSGQTTEALRVVREHRRVMVEEFGLDPSAEIEALESALLDDDPSLRVEQGGRPLRGYQLLEEVGAGSFAIVWRGTQPSVGRDVAIKQIRAELATQPAFIQRFEAEARLVARIEHPHVVPLIDYWRDPDSAYLVMRWLGGGTLERRLDDGPLGLTATLDLARQVGGALAAAHSHGVIHRDVKPANILFDEQGNAFLSDFGIALEAEESSGPEAALSPGTPVYSSPEQIRQEPLGPASDVFSLGVVLYECLAGRLPWADRSGADARLARQLEDRYPRLSDIDPTVSEAVADVIARATTKTPEQRYDSVVLLVDALDAAAGSEASPSPPGVDLVSRQVDDPYLGLLAFDDASSDRFFGRERLVARMADRFDGEGTASRCIVIVGPSGSGKSSLARAGLLPVLRDGAVAGSQDWFTTSMTPGEDPYASLEAALLRIAVDPPDTLLERLRDGERGILRGIRDCLDAGDRRMVLLIDQFEELFIGRSSEAADEFLEALAVAVADPATPLRLVITLRADYYGRPLEHPSFAPILDASTVSVTPLAGDELERAMVEPARAVGVSFEPGLVARIAAETTGQPSPLPLLQYTLAELFERRDGSTMTVSAYDEIGGLSGALGVRAEALFAEASEAGRVAMREVFGRLIDPSEETADLRARPRVADLGDDPATRWVLDRFGRARLLVFDVEVATREPTVEVAHEALLREWPRLVDWLEADRELLRATADLAAAATRWEAAGRDDADLLRGNRLAQAAELAATAPGRLRDVDVSFIERSEAEAAAERLAAARGRRRTRWLAAGIGVAAVAVLVLGGLAAVQQSRVDEEARAASIARERAELDLLYRRAAEWEDPKVRLLLALEAQRRAPGTESDRVLMRALRGGGGRSTTAMPTLAAGSCSDAWPGWVSRDGLTQTSAVDGVMVSRDLMTGEVAEHGPMPTADCGSWFGDAATGRRFAIAESGSRLWLGPWDGPWDIDIALDEGSWVHGPQSFGTGYVLVNTPDSVSLLDGRTGKPVGDPILGLASDPEPRLSPDQRFFAAVAGRDGGRASTVVVHAVVDGTELHRVDVDGVVTEMVFDPARDHLLVATGDGRVRTMDLVTGTVVGDVVTQGGHVRSGAGLGIGEDGLVNVIATEPSGLLEVIDRFTGAQAAAPLDLGAIFGGRMRADGAVLVWGDDFQVDIVEPDRSTLVRDVVDLSDRGTSLASESLLVSIHGDQAVAWETESGASWSIDLSTGERRDLAFETDDGRPLDLFGPQGLTRGGQVAVTSDGMVGLWRDGRMVDEVSVRTDAEGTVQGTRWTPDYLVVGEGTRPEMTTLHLIGVGEGVIDHRFSVRADGLRIAAPTPDGGLLVLFSDGKVALFDADGGPIAIAVEQLEDMDRQGKVLVDDDGRIVLERTATSDGLDAIEVIDPHSGERTTIPAPGAIAEFTLARGGDLIVVQSLDGTIRLADPASGTMEVFWEGDGVQYGDGWYDVATDTLRLATGPSIVELTLDPDAWRRLACEQAGRELSENEWSQLVPGSEQQEPACRDTGQTR